MICLCCVGEGGRVIIQLGIWDGFGEGAAGTASRLIGY